MSETEAVQIRRASVEDISTIKTLELACGLSPWTIAGYELEFLRTDSVILVASGKRGDTVGFIIGRVSQGPDHEAEIYNIGVLPECRGQGIGSLLITEFERISEELEAPAIWLEVRISNTGAIAFYASHGFSVEGHRRNFYSDPVEDAAVMCLRLSTPTEP